MAGRGRCASGQRAALSPAPGRRRRAAGRGLLAAASALLAVAALELGLRLLHPQHQPLEGLFREDAVGLRHQAHYRGRLRMSGRVVEVATNSRGYRDREYPPQPGAFRILGLGDSFAFGYGVEEPETYLARLEQHLAGGGVEVINAGHASMGPDNEALLLEADGPALRPHLVLAAFYAGNDLWNVLSGPDRALVRDGLLVSRPGVMERWYRPLQPGRLLPGPLATTTPYARASAARRLLLRSHAYRFVSARWAAFRARAAGPGTAARPLTPLDDEAALLRDDPPELDAGWREVAGLLARMAQWCRAHGATLVVVVVPSKVQVEPAAWDAARARFGLRGEDFDLGKPQRLVAEAGGAAGFAVVDLLPALRAAARADAPLYFADDPHWTPRGHEVAAAEILRRLRELGAVR